MMGCVGMDPDAQGSGSEKRFIKGSRQKSESGTGISRDNWRGNTGAESRGHRQGLRLGNLINIYKNQKIKLNKKGGLANKTGKTKDKWQQQNN